MFLQTASKPPKDSKKKEIKLRRVIMILDCLFISFFCYDTILYLQKMKKFFYYLNTS